MALAVATVLHADRTPAFEKHTLDVAVGFDAQIRARSDRLEVGDGSAAPSALALRDLIAPDSLLLRAVEIFVQRQPRVHAGSDERIGERIAAAQIFHGQWPVGAVILRRAALLPLRLRK